MNRLSRQFVGPLLLLLLPAFAVLWWARTAVPPATVGFATGSLPECGLTDYCSNAEYKCPALVNLDLLDAVAKAIDDLPRTTVELREGNYVHLTQRTAVWGFIDDVELLLDGNVVHARSQSRRGPINLGGNGRRLDEVNARIHARCTELLSTERG